MTLRPGNPQLIQYLHLGSPYPNSWIVSVGPLEAVGQEVHSCVGLLPVGT